VKDKIRQRTLEAYKLETNLMKKIIALAVAAAISAPVMADLTIGGSMRYQVDNGANTAADETDATTNRVLVSFAGSSTAESGLFVAADGTAQIAGGDTTQDGGVTMTIGNPMANVVLGAGEANAVYTDGGADTFRVAADDVQVRVVGRDDSNVILNITAVEGLTLQAMTQINEDNNRVMGAYDFGMAKVGLGYDDGANGVDVTSVDVSADLGGVAVGVSHASYDNANDDNSTAVRAAYMGFAVAFEAHERAGVDYDNWMANYAVANVGGLEGLKLTVGAGGSDTQDTKAGLRLDYAF